MSNVLVCTVFGEKYRRLFAVVRGQFEAYAATCGCNIELIENPLDPDNRHYYLTQRLLIPLRFSQYDAVAHIDIDILMARQLPSIFDSFPQSAGFGATLDPRGTEAYREAWGNAPFTRWSNRQYFETKGWNVDDTFRSINGGAMVFRPRLVADLFAAWYRDSSNFGDHPDSFFQCEEGILAYLSQREGLFAPLPVRFNRQVHYALHETEPGKRALAHSRTLVNRGLRKIGRILGVHPNHVGFGMSYTRFVEDLLEEGNLVHFAGNYPVPSVRRDLLFGMTREQ